MVHRGKDNVRRDAGPDCCCNAKMPWHAEIQIIKLAGRTGKHTLPARVSTLWGVRLVMSNEDWVCLGASTKVASVSTPKEEDATNGAVSRIAPCCCCSIASQVARLPAWAVWQVFPTMIKWLAHLQFRQYETAIMGNSAKRVITSNRGLSPFGIATRYRKSRVAEDNHRLRSRHNCWLIYLQVGGSDSARGRIRQSVEKGHRITGESVLNGDRVFSSGVRSLWQSVGLDMNMDMNGPHIHILNIYIYTHPYMDMDMTWIWIGKDTDVEMDMGRNDRNMDQYMNG